MHIYTFVKEKHRSYMWLSLQCTLSPDLLYGTYLAKGSLRVLNSPLEIIRVSYPFHDWNSLHCLVSKGIESLSSILCFAKEGGMRHGVCGSSYGFL
mmetsp:Transcript_2350/g.4493  ORF Transcript_2350/g.4493 Transcript_2350/m.4493 type:complete len:96 (+) Transcript_2350:25-312(+)